MATKTKMKSNTSKKSSSKKQHTNAFTYAKNVGKSVMYSTVDVLKDMNPTIASFKDTNSDTIKSAYGAVKNLKYTAQKMSAQAMDSEYGDVAKDLIANIKSDISTGKFYNMERQNKEIDSLSDTWSNIDEFDFEGSDGSFNFDDEEELDTTEMIDKVGKKSTDAMAQIMARTTEYSVAANHADNRAIYDQNKMIYISMHSGMKTINENLSKIVEIAGGPLQQHLENSTTYYEKMTELNQQRNDILVEIRDLYKSQIEPEREKSGDSRITMDDILTSEGAVNIGKYLEAVKQNMNEVTGGTVDMVKTIFSKDMMESLIASPLQFVTNSLVKTIIPKTLKSSMVEFNKSLSGAFSSGMLKLLDMDDTDDFKSLAKRIFGIEPKMATSFDTSAYEKGAVPFDGVTRKSIVEVIPTYLSQIVTALTGKNNRYDYERGRFVNMDDIESVIGDRYESTKKRTNFDIEKYIKEYKKSIDFGSKENEAQFDQDMQVILDKMFREGKMFNYKKAGNFASYGFKGGKASELNFELIKQMFAAMPKSAQLQWANNYYTNNSKLASRYSREEESGISVLTNLFNGSNNISQIPMQQNVPQQTITVDDKFVKVLLNALGVDSTNTNLTEETETDTNNEAEEDTKWKPKKGEINKKIELDPEQLRRVTEAVENKQMTADQAASELGISKSTFYKRRKPILADIAKEKRQQERWDKYAQKIANGEESESFKRVFEKLSPDAQQGIMEAAKKLKGKINKKPKTMGDIVREQIEAEKEKEQEEKKKPDYIKYNGKNILKYDELDPETVDYKTVGDAYKDLLGEVDNDTIGVDKVSDWSLEEKIENSDKLSESSVKLLKKMTKLASKPADILTNMFNKANVALYDFIFGRDENDELTEKGVAGVMVDKLKETFAKFGVWLDDRILTPLGDNIGKEFKSVGEKIADFLGLNPENVGEELRKKLFGNKNDDSDNGLIGDFTHRMGNEFKDKFGFVKNTVSGAADGIGATTKLNEKGKTKEEQNKNINDFLNSFEKVTKTESDNNINPDGLAEETSIDNFAAGTRKITKTGIAAVSEGEMIIPPDQNPFNISKRLKKENKAKDNFLDFYGDIFEGNSKDDIENFAEGGTKSGFDKKTKNRLNYLVRMIKSGKNPDRYKEKFKTLSKEEQKYVYNKLEKSRKELTPDDYEEGRDRNFGGKMLDRTKAFFTSSYGAVKEVVDDFSSKDKNGKKVDPDKDKQNFFKNTLEQAKEYLPEMAANAILGSGISMMTGFIGGPIVGAALGAGVSLISKSETVQKMLFGDKIDGERQGGIIEKDLANNIEKYAPAMAKGGTLGMITSILPFVPGGPTSGIILGSALGFASKNEKVHEYLFGEEGIIGEDFDKKVADKLPSMGVGAIAGMALGPFGAVTNLLIGSAAGFATTTNKFKDVLFGKEDKDGKRHGGIIQKATEKAISPVKNMLTKGSERFKNWAKKDILEPLKDTALTLKQGTKTLLGKIGDKIKNKIDNFFEERIGAPISKFMKDKIFKPIGGFIKKLNPFKWIGKLISAPIRGTKSLIADNLRTTLINRGDSGDMSAEQRNIFRESDSYKNSMAIRKHLPGSRKFENIDKWMQGTTAKQAGDIISKIEALESAENDANLSTREDFKVFDEMVQKNPDLSWKQTKKITKNFKKAVKAGDIREGMKMDKINDIIGSDANLSPAQKKAISEATNKYFAAVSDRENRKQGIQKQKEAFVDQLRQLDPNLEGLTVEDLNKLKKNLKTEQKFKSAKEDALKNDKEDKKANKAVSEIPDLNKAQKERHEETISALEDIVDAIKDLANKDQTSIDQVEKKYNDQYDKGADERNAISEEEAKKKWLKQQYKSARKENKSAIKDQEARRTDYHNATAAEAAKAEEDIQRIKGGYLKYYANNQASLDAAWEDELKKRRDNTKTPEQVATEKQSAKETEQRQERHDSVMQGLDEVNDNLKKICKTTDSIDDNTEKPSKVPEDNSKIENIKNTVNSGAFENSGLSDNNKRMITQSDALTGGIIEYRQSKEGGLEENTSDEQTKKTLKEKEEMSNSIKQLPVIAAGVTGMKGIISSFKEGLMGDETGKSEGGILSSLLGMGSGVLGFLTSKNPIKWITGKFAKGVGKGAKNVINKLGGSGWGLSNILLGALEAAAVGAAWTRKFDDIAAAIGNLSILKGNDTKGAFNQKSHKIIYDKEGNSYVAAVDENGNYIKNEDGQYQTTDGEYVDAEKTTETTDRTFFGQVKQNFINKTIRGKGSLTSKMLESSAENMGKGIRKFTNKLDDKIIKHQAKKQGRKAFTETLVREKSLFKATQAKNIVKESAETASKEALKNGAKSPSKKILDKIIKKFDGIGNFIKKCKRFLPDKIVKKSDKFLPAIKKCFGEAVEKVGKSKLGHAVKSFAKLASGPIGAAVWAVGTASNAWGNAESILGITEDATVGQRLVAMLVAVCNTLIPCIGDLFSNSTLVNIFLKVVGMLGIHFKELEEQRERAQKEVDAYNEEHGTDLTIEEYNQMNGKAGWATKTKNWAKDKAEDAKEFFGLDKNKDKDKKSNKGKKKNTKKIAGMSGYSASGSKAKKENTKKLADMAAYSASGSRFVGSGSGVKDDGTFISQLDPRYANQQFNVSGDTSIQTLGDTGCGPAAAAMVVNKATNQQLTMEQAAKEAKRYKVQNSGVSADYFADEFSKNGLISEYITDNNSTDRSNAITSHLRNGHQVVLMGQDASNTSKINSPYGPTAHYIVANKISDDGKYIWVNDPESKKPNMRYSASSVLNATKMGVAGYAASGSKISKGLRNLVRGYRGRGVTLVGSSTNEQAYNFFIDAGFSSEAAAAAVGNLCCEAGTDSSGNMKVNSTESNGEGVGIVQWSHGRKTAFINYTKSAGDPWPGTSMGTQLAFLLTELDGSQWKWPTGSGYNYDKSYNISFDEFKSCTNIDTATGAWCAKFERPKTKHAHLDRRIAKAYEVYNLYSGKHAAAPGNINSSTGSTTEEKSSESILDGITGLVDKMSAAYGLSGNTSGDSSGNTNSVTSGGSDQQNKLVDSLKGIEGTLAYSQKGPRNPDKGSADCSSTVGWAYKKILGVDPGNTTRDMATDSDLYTVTESLDPNKFQPGDILLYKNSKGTISHVEMYAGNNQTIGHGGGKNGTTKGPTIKKDVTKYRPKDFAMARRWTGFQASGTGLKQSDTVQLKPVVKPNFLAQTEDKFKYKSIELPASYVAAGSGLAYDKDIRLENNTSKKPEETSQKEYFAKMIMLLNAISSNTANINAIVEILKKIAEIEAKAGTIDTSTPEGKKQVNELSNTKNALIATLKNMNSSSDKDNDGTLEELIENIESISRM